MCHRFGSGNNVNKAKRRNFLDRCVFFLCCENRKQLYGSACVGDAAHKRRERSCKNVCDLGVKSKTFSAHSLSDSLGQKWYLSVFIQNPILVFLVSWCWLYTFQDVVSPTRKDFISEQSVENFWVFCEESGEIVCRINYFCDN